MAQKANFNDEQNLALTKRLHKLDKQVLKFIERNEAAAREAYLKASKAYSDAMDQANSYRYDVARDARNIQREEATQAKEKAIERAKAADQAFRDQMASNVAAFDAKHKALMAAKKAEAKARQHCKDCGGTFGDGEVS